MLAQALLADAASTGSPLQSYASDALVGVLAVVLLATRQLRERPVREKSSIRFAIVLAAIGAARMITAAGRHAVLPYLAVSIATQRELIRLRARRELRPLPHGEGSGLRLVIGDV